MYGANNPVRPMASWMVATPYFASSLTAAGGARRTLRTAIPDLPIMSSPVLPDVSGNQNLATHQQPRRAQQRGACDFSGLAGAHLEHHGEFPARMLHRERLARAG